jgi:hypothetical protein
VCIRAYMHAWCIITKQQNKAKKKNQNTHTHTLTHNTKGLSDEVAPNPSAVTKFRSQHNALSHSKNEELHGHYKTDWEMLRTCNFLDLLLLLMLLCVCVCVSLSVSLCLCGVRFRVSLWVSLCPEMATEISTQRDSSRDITPKKGREDKSGQARFCARGDGGAMCWMCTHMHTHAHKCTIHKGSKGRIDQKRKGIKQWSIHYNTHLSAGFERPPAERRIGIPPPRESDDAVRDRNALP